ncbi:ribosyldihydronicotinamide dehydrogenase [quinone] isoform 5 [Mus musculus]|uniref:ribosyldihydronicotinamide dehydrogenase [quinone] isoform 5 n=1 Tax=Mus musculus TaxID=10090 RepID=UPI002A759453|nr:ribosyldihydronicotinamide dehydrogenase [quinone] isoform 5 [Mus musculus]NP_001413093.1 ribosyldihydronicotinamide dehydrogenase [quinone] isoform 5 [Mus musculus]
MAGKKVLIVYAHQEPKSFNGSLKKVAVEELSKQGCTVTVSDLYSMNFEPRATRNDITGAPSNPDVFSYGIETHEAYKKKALTSDIFEEQRKVQEADLVIFQFPLYWFSVPAILKGWMDRVLCRGFAFDIPGFYDSGFLKHGTLHFCGFKVLAPQISFGLDVSSEEERKVMLASWAQRLKSIWKEEPIHCTPPWYFQE